MTKQINELEERIVEYLGVDKLPIEYQSDIDEDSRLATEGKVRIIINSKYEENYIEIAKCLAHEYRHAFQIYWTAVMVEDPLAKIWKEELCKPINTATDAYECQAIEIDAFAFTQTFLAKEGIQIKHGNELYQKLIEKYITKYSKYL